MLIHLRKSIKRNGIDLEKKEQERLKEINQKLVKLQIKFVENLMQSKKEDLLLVNSASELEGLSEKEIKSAK